jgi:hypothetical protein
MERANHGPAHWQEYVRRPMLRSGGCISSALADGTRTRTCRNACNLGEGRVKGTENSPPMITIFLIPLGARV